MSRDGATLPRRLLGRSGLEISRVGFGGWGIGGGAWKFEGTPEQDESSLRAIARALDVGVNWIDTAPTYGFGHSEEVVGHALRRLAPGDRPLVFTKCGRRWDSRDAEQRSDLRREAIREDCEASLHRLGVEAIDLLQFHWPDQETGTPVEESWSALHDLVEEGKVRAAGVSNFDVPLLERCERLHHVDSLQLPFSLVARGAAEALLPWCEAHDTGVIVYSPMSIGLLTGSFTPDRLEELHAEDWRRKHPEFRSPRLERNLALRDGLRTVAESHATTVEAVAVAWTLSWAGVTGAIVGARRADQVDGWAGAANLALTAADLDLIEEAVARSRAGQGPTRPPTAASGRG